MSTEEKAALPQEQSKQMSPEEFEIYKIMKDNRQRLIALAPTLEAVNKELLQALETVKTWLSHFTGYGSVVVGGAAEQVVIIDRAIAKARGIRGQ